MSVNKSILVGRLGKDPETRDVNGTTCCTFSMATERKWTDKQGERKKETDWHDVVAWGRMGENAAKYLSKGKQVYVEGRMQTREWEDRDGNKKRRTEVVASDIQFLGGRDEGRQGSRGGYEPAPF